MATPGKTPATFEQNPKRRPEQGYGTEIKACFPELSPVRFEKKPPNPTPHLSVAAGVVVGGAVLQTDTTVHYLQSRPFRLIRRGEV